MNEPAPLAHFEVIDSGPGAQHLAEVCAGQPVEGATASIVQFGPGEAPALGQVVTIHIDSEEQAHFVVIDFEALEAAAPGLGLLEPDQAVLLQLNTPPQQAYRQ